MQRPSLTLAIMLAALPFSARAQRFQFLPEINTYYKFDPNLRVYFQAKDTREGEMPTTAEIGPSLEFHLKPLHKLGEFAAFDLDKIEVQTAVAGLGSVISRRKTSRTARKVSH